jgi:hypothetical protein
MGDGVMAEGLTDLASYSGGIEFVKLRSIYY